MQKVLFEYKLEPLFGEKPVVIVKAYTCKEALDKVKLSGIERQMMIIEIKEI